MHESVFFSGYEFKLYGLNDNNDIIVITYKGAYFIVDNEYLDWSCTVPPMKHPLSHEDIRFSEWIESIKKILNVLLVFWSADLPFWKME